MIGDLRERDFDVPLIKHLFDVLVVSAPDSSIDHPAVVLIRARISIELGPKINHPVHLHIAERIFRPHSLFPAVCRNASSIASLAYSNIGIVGHTNNRDMIGKSAHEVRHHVDRRKWDNVRGSIEIPDPHRPDRYSFNRSSNTGNGHDIPFIDRVFNLNKGACDDVLYQCLGTERNCQTNDTGTGD